MNQIVLPEKVVKEVLAYLSTKPYREVVTLINAIKGSAETVCGVPTTTSAPAAPKPEVNY